jgi:hypothetical protein
MKRYVLDGTESQLRVWTYKEGLLSRVAHDLCIQATGVEGSVEVAEAEGGPRRLAVTVRFPTKGLRVQGQAKDGRVVPLKFSDHQEIERNLTGDSVLAAQRNPEVSYGGEGTLTDHGAQIDGSLTLAGQQRSLPLRAQVREDGDGLRVEGEVRFLQSTFGIKPFRALMGALKLQDGVRVSWSLLLRPEA